MLNNIEIIEENLNKINYNYDLIRRGFDFNSLKEKLIILKKKSSDPNIWNNNQAKKIFKELKVVENKLNDYENLKKSITNLNEFFTLSKNDNDQKLLDELSEESIKVLKMLKESDL